MPDYTNGTLYADGPCLAYLPNFARKTSLLSCRAFGFSSRLPLLVSQMKDFNYNQCQHRATGGNSFCA